MTKTVQIELKGGDRITALERKVQQLEARLHQHREYDNLNSKHRQFVIAKADEDIAALTVSSGNPVSATGNAKFLRYDPATGANTFVEEANGGPFVISNFGAEIYEDEIVHGYFEQWSNRFIGFGYTKRLGKVITSAIAEGGTGTIQIYEGKPPVLVTGRTISNVRHEWMDSGGSISVGREVIIEWDETDLCWRVTHAECET